MSWEAFLIMSIATERFLVVCQPLLYRRHRLRFSSFIHLLTFILPGLLCAIVINIPKFFEAELVFEENSIDFQATALRLDEDYIYYYTHWTRLLATGVVPTLYLVCMNTIIIVKIRKGMVIGPLREITAKYQWPKMLPKYKENPFVKTVEEYKLLWPDPDCNSDCVSGL